jgi:hypothetical protein
MVTAAFICLIGAFLATFGGNSVVSVYMDRFAKKLKAEHEKLEATPERGFPEGGKLIGQLERFLILMFVLAGKPEGVGFLVAAKSVFRFGELTNNQNRLEAEYITIGTLMSFSWGMAVALLTKFLMDRALS